MNQKATAGTNLTGLVAAPQRSQEMPTGTDVQQFQEALRNEQDHLDKVQAWLAPGQGRT